MTSFIAKKIFKESVANKFGKEDPYFETVPATRLGGKPKKRRKANPPGLSENDERVLTKVKRRAYRLDMSLFNCCGIRFGWSSVIGLVPAIGDVLDMGMALMVFRTCNEVDDGLPLSLKFWMMVNIVFDFAVGLVPVLGDLADAVFRANTRNAALLENFLRERGKQNLRASGVPQPAIDPSDPDQFDRMEAGDAARFTSSQPPSYEGMIMAPQQARIMSSRGGRSGHHIPPTGGRTVRDSARPRNELRDMEEGVVSHHPTSASRKQAPHSSRNKRSSRRGR